MVELREDAQSEQRERRDQEQQFAVRFDFTLKIYSTRPPFIYFKQRTVLFIRVADMQAAVAEQSRRRDEAVHTLESLIRDRDHINEQERLRLAGKMAEITEEVSKKVLQKEIKLRQEFQEKFSTVESVRYINVFS